MTVLVRLLRNQRGPLAAADRADATAGSSTACQWTTRNCGFLSMQRSMCALTRPRSTCPLSRCDAACCTCRDAPGCTSCSNCEGCASDCGNLSSRDGSKLVAVVIIVVVAVVLSSIVILVKFAGRRLSRLHAEMAAMLYSPGRGARRKARRARSWRRHPSRERGVRIANRYCGGRSLPRSNSRRSSRTRTPARW